MNGSYDQVEQEWVGEAKALERQASELRRQADERRRDRIRVSRAVKEAAERERQRERENFEDRTRVFLSKLSRYLKDEGLKIVGPSLYGSNTGSKIILKDGKTGVELEIQVTETGFRF